MLLQTLSDLFATPLPLWASWMLTSNVSAKDFNKSCVDLHVKSHQNYNFTRLVLAGTKYNPKMSRRKHLGEHTFWKSKPSTSPAFQ